MQLKFFCFSETEEDENQVSTELRTSCCLAATEDIDVIAGVQVQSSEMFNDSECIADVVEIELKENKDSDKPPCSSSEPIEDPYFGCGVCREAKSIKKDSCCPRCPICQNFSAPCSHLLKIHMRDVHGWFTVQRRFNVY